jgi:anaerobic magnesium-protoporphyrin IX monomethyl ester cyclase
MVRALMPDDIGVSVTYPLPGTGLHDRVRHELGEKTHWADSDDLTMMFQGTYTTAFYRQIHARLHHEFDLRRAMARGSAAAAAALPDVMAEWDRMAATEAEHRSVAPVRPVRLPMSARPLLVMDAN